MLDCKIAVGRELNGGYHCVPVSLGSAVIGAPLSCPLSVTLSRLLPPPALTDGFNTTNMSSPNGFIPVFNESNRLDSPSIKLHFLILGGGVTGLAAAIALRRAGHRVTVLNTQDHFEKTWGATSCIVPPNMSKLIVRWGMGEKLKELSMRSRRILLSRFVSGEIIGVHHWLEEILRDTGGDCLFMHYADLKQTLYQSATSHGAGIHPGPDIASIAFDDPRRPSVILTSGEILHADIIVATDGPNSVARGEILTHEVKDTNLGFSIFQMSVHKSDMARDPALSEILEQKTTVFTWLGDTRCVMGYIAGTQDIFSLQIYTPVKDTQDYWGKDVSSSKVLEFMGTSEPRLQRMVELAKTAKCLPVSEPPELENWVHPSGRLILIGDTAHPFPYGATQGVAVCIADAAALGEFFRHLNNDSQIKSFLLAFEEIRKERIQNVLKSEFMNLTGMTLPDGEFQQMRDNSFKRNYDLGLDAFDGEDKAARARWEMDKDVFAYDAEEHAAEWWNDWGLLKERAYASESAQTVHDALGPVHIQVSSQSQDIILRGYSS